MPELATTTKNFSSDLIIGDGSFELVYKTTLSNSVTIAIKKLNRDAFHGLHELWVKNGNAREASPLEHSEDFWVTV
ncbi:hypothetical protein SLE2022_289350 [Rubroshorea leprosula]